MADEPAKGDEPMAGPAAHPTGQGEAGTSAGAGQGRAEVTLKEGQLENAAHGLRFAVPKEWTLQESATADEMVLRDPACDACILRVLIVPGGDGALEDTIRILKEQALESPGARILDEQRTRVARKKAYTLVKEEPLPEEGPAYPSPAASRPAPAAPRTLLSRYVTFNRGGDKYYFLLRAPREQFPKHEAAFEKLLAGLRFVPSE